MIALVRRRLTWQSLWQAVVETGETLRQNGLVELLTLREISTLVVANRAGLKLGRERIRPLLRALAEG